jgi:hypothetical protein
MTVPFAFANLSGNIALSKLDSNFNTPITIGNTSVLLGNTVTTLNNLTLANVTITSGTSNIANVNVTNVTVTNLTATLANVTTLNVASAFITSANIGTLALTNALTVSSGGTGQVTFPANSVLLGNGTGGIATVAPGNVGNVLTSIGGAWVSNAVSSTAAAGSNTQVQYNNSGALAGSANLTFNGTTLTANTLNLTNALGTTYGGTGLTSFTSGGVVYASSSSALTTGSVLTFDGTNLGNTQNTASPIGLVLNNSSVSTSAGTRLTFKYGGSTTGYVGNQFDGGDFNNQYQANQFHIWLNGASETMRLTSTGLGIGTSSPGAKLTVNGEATVNGLRLGKGISSGANNTVFGLGAGASQTTGASNTIIGSASGASITTAASCTFIGRAAGNGGSGNASNNTGVGDFALAGGSAIGIGNTGIGSGGILANTNSTAAIYNSAVGYAAFNGLTSGSYNTALGWQALTTLTTETNCSGVGAGSTVTGSNQVQLGDASTTTYVYGTVQNRSDLRDKADVRDTQLGLAFVNALRPVDYKLDMRDDYKPARPDDVENAEAMAAWREASKIENLTHDGSKKRLRYHHGLIAQEVKAVLDAQGIDFGGYQDHKIKGGDDVLSIGYDELIAPLIKSIQELTARIAQLEAK